MLYVGSCRVEAWTGGMEVMEGRKGERGVFGVRGGDMFAVFFGHSGVADEHRWRHAAAEWSAYRYSETSPRTSPANRIVTSPRLNLSRLSLT